MKKYMDAWFEITNKLNEIGCFTKMSNYKGEDKFIRFGIFSSTELEQLPQRDNDVNVEFNEYISQRLDNWKFVQVDDSDWSGIALIGNFKEDIELDSITPPSAEPPEDKSAE